MRELKNIGSISVVAYQHPFWDKTSLFEVGEWVLSTWEGDPSELIITLTGIDYEVPPMSEIQDHVQAGIILEKTDILYTKSPEMFYPNLRVLAFIEETTE